MRFACACKSVHRRRCLWRVSKNGSVRKSRFGGWLESGKDGALSDGSSDVVWVRKLPSLAAKGAYDDWISTSTHTMLMQKVASADRGEECWSWEA